MDIAQGILSTANALGINPIDLATAISYETAGTFNPLQLGPETKFGQHRGLIQFGEPQANQYGVSFETRPQAISTQLGPGAGIYQYLKAVGVQPGMGLEQIYSAINTGGVNNLNMTDQRAGGMPGTVAEKVAGMGDHRKNAQKFMELVMQNQPLNTSPLLNPINNNKPPIQNPTGMDKNPLFSMLGKTVGGGFNKLKDAVTGKDPDASDRLAIAMMSLSGNPQQLAPLMQLAANDIQERKKTRKQNQTIAYLESVDPKLAEMARANPAMITQIMQSLASTAVSGKSGKVMTAEQVKELYPDADIKPGLYNVKFKDNIPVEVKPMSGGSVKNIFDLTGENDPANEIDKKLNQGMGVSMSKMLNAASASAQILPDLDTLEALVDVQPTGFIPGRIADMFPELDNAAAIRQSIVKRIAPLMRVEGSGSTSDIEFAAMLNAYGSLANTPEANRAILAVMRQKHEFNLARAKIVRQYQADRSNPDKRSQALQIANAALTELENNSGIKPAVQQILAQYRTTGSPDVPNNPENKPKKLIWDGNKLVEEV
mgnify:CR=1 FL=1